ncbi:MAG: carbohydrate ABC transporter permease [Bacilli bacterium]|nr:carbohydrate ABC transporter permease [Bacilli bacterium]
MSVNTKDLVLVLADDRIDTETLEKRQRIMKIIVTIITYAFLTLMAFVILIPFYWMLITSLKDVEEIRATIPTLWPENIMWSNYNISWITFENIVDKYGSPAAGISETEWIRMNYDKYIKEYSVRDVFEQFDFITYLRNTVIVGVLSTLGTLITTIFAAFAFARLNFKGKDFLFSIFLGTMMIPGEMMVITNYITVAPWLQHPVGVFAAMIVPFWVSVFYIYLLRQNFKQIPNELYYASKVDGKTDWQYLWQVMVPIARPTLITIFILKLMGAWNSYVWPNLVANDSKLRLITNGLRASFTNDQYAQPGLQMAATVIVTVPLLLLFVFFRKYIMSGVGRAGLKG